MKATAATCLVVLGLLAAACAQPTAPGAPITLRVPASPVATPGSSAGTATSGPAGTASSGPAGTASSGPAGTASSGPARTSSPAPTPPPPTATGGTVTLTEADAGRTVVVAVGGHVRVRLGQSGATWDPPTSSSDTVLPRRSSTGGYPTGRPVDATFDAVAAGSADVTATSDAACFHTQPRCMMASRAWQVHIRVG